MYREIKRLIWLIERFTADFDFIDNDLTSPPEDMQTAKAALAEILRSDLANA